MWLAGDRQNELYNLKNDPAEQNNVIAEHTELANEMELNIRKFVEHLR